MHAVSRSYSVRHEDSNDFIMIQGGIYYIFISGTSLIFKTLIDHQSFAKEIWRCHSQKSYRV